MQSVCVPPVPSSGPDRPPANPLYTRDDICRQQGINYNLFAHSIIAQNLPGWLCRIIAAFDDELVGLATFHSDFRYQLVVNIPGNAPRWLPGNCFIATFAARRTNAGMELALTLDLSRGPRLRAALVPHVVQRVLARMIILKKNGVVNENPKTAIEYDLETYALGEVNANVVGIVIAGGVRMCICLLAGIEWTHCCDYRYITIDRYRYIVDGLVRLQQALITDCGDAILAISTD